MGTYTHFYIMDFQLSPGIFPVFLSTCLTKISTYTNIDPLLKHEAGHSVFITPGLYVSWQLTP